MSKRVYYDYPYFRKNIIDLFFNRKFGNYGVLPDDDDVILDNISRCRFLVDLNDD